MRQLSETKEICILSPHLDDAIFSLGGWISARSRSARISVINIFSRSGFANKERMDVEIGSKIRKTEDAIALGNAGVMMIRNLDFPEALERGMDLSAVFRDALPQQSSEKMLIDDVRREIQSLLANESIVLSPSGFGGHIDHLITRIAAESLQKTIYYADLPYAARTSKTATARSFLSGKRREATPASIPDIEEHLKLARIYASQIQDRHLGEMRAQLKEKGYPFWS